MKKRDVKVGKVYGVKVSNRFAPVRLDTESPHGGWDGTNLKTGRSVRIKTAGKLRYELHQCSRARIWHKADHE